MPRRRHYEIVCPDHKIRHYPHSNEKDAECDAEYYTARGCRLDEDILHRCGDCPGGSHRVQLAIFSEPAQPELRLRGVLANTLMIDDFSRWN